jgi:hypothetical protein
MQEMLYKTTTPVDLLSEYYEIAILARKGNGYPGYMFIEKHGWWDERSNQLKHSLTAICPDEGLTLEQAQEMYRERRAYRARVGFIHSFSPYYDEQIAFNYKLIEV